MSEAAPPTFATLKASVEAQDWVAAKAQADALLAAGGAAWQVLTYRAFAHSHLERPDLALADYEQALRSAPENVALLNNAASLYLARSQPQVAADLYRRALQLQPQAAYLHANLGLALSQLGQHAQAARTLQQAFVLGHVSVDLRMDCAHALEQAGEVEAAVAQYDAVIAAQPEHARALNNRAALRLAQGRAQEALRDAHAALAIRPDYALAALGVGNALMALERHEAAAAAFGQALALNEHLVAARNNRGNAWRALGLYEAACQDYAAAVAQCPSQVEYTMGWVASLGELGQHEQATRVLDEAITRQPSNAVLHFAQGLNLLSQGQWPWGWFHFEFRYGAPEGFAVPYPTRLPQWSPESSAKRVLVTTEWGLGDQVMFGSMLGDLQSRWDLDLTVAIDPRLLKLMGEAYPRLHLVSRRDPIHDDSFEAHVSLISLGQHLRKTDADFVPSAGGYLRADAQRSRVLRAQLLGGRQRLVGISWRTLREDAEARNIDLVSLLHALGALGVSLVSLQYGDMDDEIAAAVAASGVPLQVCASVDNRDDIDGLAALISACDVVVSIDNTTVHLAGALGVPTWVMLQRKADWRWMVEGRAQPWYNTVHPLRQAQSAQWSPVLAQVVSELTQAWGLDSAL